MAKKQSKAARKQTAQTPAPAPEQRTPPDPQTAPAKQAAHAPKVSAASAAKLPWWKTPAFLFAVLGVLLFVMIGIQGGGSDKNLCIILAVIFIAASIGARPIRNMSGRLSFPVLAVFLYLILNAAAGLYSRFGNFAVGEWAKIFSAFCVFGMVIFRMGKEHAKPLAATISSVTAAFALVSIDASSWKVLFGVFAGFFDRIGCAYANMNTGYEAGVRVTGVFGNANILAGMLAVGIFLALYLVTTAQSRKTQLLSCVLLGINALCFLLNFSMGAIAMFVLAVLIYLLAARKGQRLPLFLLMVETAVITLLLTFVSFSGLGVGGGRAVLPVLCALASGPLLWALHRFVGERVTAALSAHTRAAGLVIGGVALLAVLYVVLGYNLSGGYTFEAGETLRRSVYPAPGAYTLVSASGDGGTAITVESQNRAQTITHTSTVLYKGALSDASFTVPEDSTVVYLSFSSDTGARLDTVSLSGGPSVKLGYTLLPGFVANRIQGLWANQNFIQRIIFWQDGLKIYAAHPVFGNGLGSVEGLVTSVQDFFYESRYVHNQYVQVLAEMGIPGILSFLLLLGAPAVTLVKRRREGEDDPLLACLTACLAMLALHGAVEAVWSISNYQTVALLVLAFIGVCYARPIGKLTGKVAAWICSIACWVFAAVFAFLMYGNLSATRQYAEINAGTRTQTPYSMTQLAGKDRYNWAQYKLDMAVNAAQSEVPEFAQTAADYAEQLRKLEIFSINDSLLRYAYLPMGQVEEAFTASREGIPQSGSRVSTWRDQFSLYEQVFCPYGAEGAWNVDSAQWYAGQILQTYDMLVDYNRGRLEFIMLTAQNNAFLNRVLALRDAGAEGQEAAALLRALLFDSASAPDADSDGVPDQLAGAAASGNRLSLNNGASLKLFSYYAGDYVLTLSGCSDPAALAGATLDGAPLALTAEGDTLTAVFSLPEGGGEHTLAFATSGALEAGRITVTAQ